MLNTVALIGRIVKKPILKELENGKKVCDLEISVPKHNEHGRDLVPCVLYQGIAENVVKYCESGDIVGVKGSVHNDDGSIKIIAEKVTFLSTSKKDEENE